MRPHDFLYTKAGGKVEFNKRVKMQTIHTVQRVQHLVDSSILCELWQRSFLGKNANCYCIPRCEAPNPKSRRKKSAPLGVSALSTRSPSPLPFIAIPRDSNVRDTLALLRSSCSRDLRRVGQSETTAFWYRRHHRSRCGKVHSYEFLSFVTRGSQPSSAAALLSFDSTLLFCES